MLNPAAANYFDYLLGGYQIDRGAANADIFMSMVPQSDEWAFTSEVQSDRKHLPSTALLTCLSRLQTPASGTMGELAHGHTRRPDY